MKRLWGALGLVLALSVFMPRVAAAQQQDPKVRRNGATLGQNYPNPFNPETRIPFSVGDDAPTCSNTSRQYRVTLKIYNVIAGYVATPVLQGGSNGVAGGQPLENLSITCGQYVAYWDGKVQATGREAASGMYLYRLEVDGVPLVGKMVNMK
ncbi:hypothetical protein [Gemmatimonas aurantiaca]|uniref:hypothetical protein n=1 Tax=Gemmatimonas aurantiaca TaxID=173480 RepID=UPI00301C36B2